MVSMLQDNMLLAKQRMKLYADTHRTEREFKVDDWVFLRMQPFKPGNSLLRRPTKLSVKYFGSFRVSARIGPVAYKLDLPPDCKMHDVFHVSQLKKKLKTRTDPIPVLPPLNSDGVPQIGPTATLDRRVIQSRNRQEAEYLVEW